MLINDLIEAGLSTPERQAYGKQIVTNLKGIEASFRKYEPELQTAINQVKKGNTIWRGVPSDKRIMLVDPTKVERKAANTHNFVNIIQSNSKAWKKFPPRNRSMICSTDESTARAYSYGGSGGAYIVLPFGDPLIGITPSGDFWDGFINSNGTDVYSFNTALNFLYAKLQMIFNGVTNPGATKDIPNDPQGFYETLKWMEKKISVHRPKIEEELKKERYIHSSVFQLLSQPNLTKGIEQMFDPIKAGFEVEKLSQFKSIGNQEVWFSSPAILIKDSLLLKLTK